MLFGAPVYAPPRQPLCTARLLLRPYCEADEAVFFKLLSENRERLQPAFPSRVAAVQTPADARRVLVGFDQDWRTGRLYVFGFWEQTTGHYLGDISLKPTWQEPVTAEIGYYLSREAEGHGYAREALAAAVEFGFREIPGAARLLIRCRSDNPRSCAVAEACGFRRANGRTRRWPGRSQPEIFYYALARPQ
ncbi:GNAT family N-acetyltransferase [Hymenobacter sp. BT175]|uniref:GNAT family N-acetyltransferase n=1 Tax=Hymenobacter translucens TaxID=2886507 RepID=UPI001D0EED59|nr:GNAT family N-acetyltransferase [Hymenobacter translucens]MCC2548416.1 GNAT family N-acetyltransferase [Hymenobacter translucens]